MTVNVHEIDYSLFELNQAIKNHYEWAGKLLSLSLLGGDPDEEIMDPRSWEKCRFNRWLQTLPRVKDEPNEALLARITHEHKDMHVQARTLMHAIVSHSASNDLMRRYLNAENAFISSIDKYKEYLFSFRNMHDTLTGLPLRHLLYTDFDLIRQRGCNGGNKLYLLIMDIDRFKRINDTWGHNAGDDVLRRVAQILNDGTRNAERVYRFGGEEFIMLLEAKDEIHASIAGARICAHLASKTIPVQDQELVVTMTCGLTEVLPTEPLHDAIGRADKAMYHGKNTGRNRCILADSLGELVNVSE